MLKKLLMGLAALVVGVALGAGSLWYMLFRASPTPVISVGIWRMNPLAGSAANDPYSRLRIAITSILALNKSETIYFEALADNDGAPLSAACDYTLIGQPPEARWWSVTAYGPDDMLIQSQSRSYSASAATVSALSTGEVQIALTPDGSGPNGIATGNGTFALLLRLYQPSEGLAAAPDSAPLFRLVKGACRA